MDRSDQRIGTMLKGKWRIDALLGTGGMASVYGATHRNGKRVAVKMLHPELSAEPTVRARFLREGYAANSVGHRGAVVVDDDDVTDDGAAFLVMELLEGEALEERRRRSGGALAAAEVLGFADQLLDVLAAAHDKNIVHRDLKPENLFLTNDGVIKVLDFGIARLREGTESGGGTRIGTIMGTPAFMAPEQARARWELVDGRTDLWAVGATMFVLLSGRHVREADTVNEELALAITTPAPPIATVVPGIDPRVAAIVDRALAHDKEQRWPDARAMQKALREVLSLPLATVTTGEPAAPPRDAPQAPEAASAGTMAPRTISAVTPAEPARRRPWMGAAIVAGAVVLAVAVVLARPKPPAPASVLAETAASAASMAPASASAQVAAPPPSSPEPSVRPISVADLPDVAPSSTASAVALPSASAVTTPPRARAPAAPRAPPPPRNNADPFSARR